MAKEKIVTSRKGKLKSLVAGLLSIPIMCGVAISAEHYFCNPGECERICAMEDLDNNHTIDFLTIANAWNYKTGVVKDDGNIYFAFHKLNKDGLILQSKIVAKHKYVKGDSLQIKDADNNGYKDLVFFNRNSSKETILYNDGKGNFR